MANYPDLKDNLSSLKRDYIFQNYVIGDFNRDLYQVILGFVTKKEPAYNPLIITSESGMGKSHLLHSIGNYLIQRKIEESVFLLNQDSLINFESLMKKDKTILTQLKSIKVFLVDDIDILLKYRSITNLFEVLLEFFYNKGVRTVITSTKPIKSLPLSGKTLAIINSGFTTKIKRVNLKDRARLLAYFLKKWKIRISPEVAKYIVHFNNLKIRDLRNIVNKMFVYSNLQKIEITKDIIDNIINDIGVKEQKIMSGVEPAPPVTKQENEDLMRAEYKEKLYVWEMKGFNVDSLKKSINAPIEDLRIAFITFTSNIQRLIDLNKRFGMLNETRFPSQIKKVGKMLFNPDIVEDLETWIRILEIRNAVQIETFRNLNENMRANNYFISKTNKQIFDTTTNNLPRKNIRGVSFYIRGYKKTGKTHLLHAIFNKIYFGHPDILVYYIDAQKLVRIMEKDGEKKFLAKYSYIDFLLVDDIHKLLLISKEKWQKLIDFFNTLIAHQKIIILSSDRELFKPLNEIKNISLQTLDYPDFELKKSYIKYWFNKNKINIKPEVLNLLAYSFGKNFGIINDRLNSLYENLLKIKPDYDIKDILNLFPELRIISEGGKIAQPAGETKKIEFTIGDLFTFERLINDY
ncbi:MAG: ATP-binding protein [Proteobacteria bacterium]|nr:ATP-binding protein [Pseudomonadota bacterium]